MLSFMGQGQSEILGKLRTFACKKNRKTPNVYCKWAPSKEVKVCVDRICRKQEVTGTEQMFVNVTRSQHEVLLS